MADYYIGDSLCFRDNEAMTNGYTVKEMPPGYIPEGYVFVNWRDDAGNQYIVGHYFEPGQSVPTLYANLVGQIMIDYNCPEDQISYVMDNTSITFSYDDNSVELPMDCPARKYGYSFIGWSFDKNTHEPEYNLNDIIENATPGILYAIWCKEFEIYYYPDPEGEESFDSDGYHIHALFNQEGNNDGSITITVGLGYNPKYRNYILKGWTTNSKSSEVEFQDGHEFTISSTAETAYGMFAVWEKIDNNVKTYKNNRWNNGLCWIKDGTEWKRAIMWKNVDGSWKR